MNVLNPETNADFEKYFELRWRILRKPWGQAKGTEKDELDESTYHVMICEHDRQPIGVGRIQCNNEHETQIRYMAVDEAHQRKGVGTLLMNALEEYAIKKKAKYIILNAREPAVPFYTKHGYHIEKKAYLLFGSIQHFLMKKVL